MSPKSQSKTQPGGVDWKEVNRVLEFMNEQGLEEFEFAQGDLHIRLRKPGSAPVAYQAPALPNHAPAAGQHSAASAPASPPPAAGVEPEAAAEGLHTIKSPIVGTFYSAANPDSPPFVKVGDHVDPGKVLCIIEAMKLMNEIESDVAGEVVQVLVASGQPVEYGEPLFALRLAGPGK